ncbi:MAG: OPT/YSL family transporter, partial [Gemmatimonadaceae bacterium]
GYIIGPTIAGYLFAGGLLSFFVLIPIIKLFGAALTSPIFPATKLIAAMSPAEVRANYVYYIGAGGVTTAGLISLVKGLPTIWQALVAGMGGFRGSKDVAGSTRRTMREIPMGIVLGGIVLCGIAMVLLPQIGIHPLGAVLAIFFSFLFVTVSSRITGQIGSSANPVSGMTVAAVLLTSLIFLGIGWTRIEHRVLALSIAGVVCVSAAVAGATSQDLKTGHLVGATPRRQQISLVFGVVTSAILIGWMINFLNDAKTTRVARSYPGVTVANLEQRTMAGPDGRQYRVGHLYEQTGAAPAGRYLVDQAGAIRYLLDPGIGGREPVDASGKRIDKLDSPKAQIMALVVDGILTQKLPWALILIGAFIAIAMEILGLPSLAVSVGVYLPISTSATMFLGGAVRWLVERRTRAEAAPNAAAHAEGDSGPGVLFSSGLIAGGAIMGVVFAGLQAKGWDAGLNMSRVMGSLAENALLAILVFAATVLLPLYLVARRSDVPPSH